MDILNIISNMVSFILSPDLQNTLLPVKIFFLGVFLLFALVIIVFILRTQWLKYRAMEDIYHFFSFKPYGMRALSKPWVKIMKKLKTGKESEYKLAVVEAHNMIDSAFEKAGYSGKNLLEKIEKLGPSVFFNKQDLLKARNIRNEVISNPDFKLELDQAKKVLDIYKRALIDLGLL